MCTRSYPECSAYGEGADGVCDMDSSAENANSSDSLNPTRKARSRLVTAISESSVKTHDESSHLFLYWSIFFSLYLYFVLCPPNHLTVSAFLSAVSREEQFEDYGEGEDVDFTPSSPCPEEDTRTNGFSDLGSSLPSRLVAGQDDHFW